MAVSWRNKDKGAAKLCSLIHPGSVIFVLDTETTGTSSKSSRIIQFSGILFKVADDYSLKEAGHSIDIYINPLEPIPAKVTEITGITDDVVKFTLPMSERIGQIASFIKAADVLAGHNILAFDSHMLQAEADRLGYKLPDRPIVDTLNLSRDWFRKGTDVEDYKLGTIFDTVYPDVTLKYHNSFEDVKATSMLLEMFIREAYEICNNLDDLPENDSDKQCLFVQKVYPFINDHNKRQQRICLLLSEGGKGDIFYDAVDHQWSCKSNSSAKKLFSKVDMADIEQQVLSRYHYSDMDKLAKSWLAHKRENDKNKNSARKKGQKQQIGNLFQ